LKVFIQAKNLPKESLDRVMNNVKYIIARLNLRTHSEA